jgi:hypothetical protein
VRAERQAESRIFSQFLSDPAADSDFKGEPENLGQ